MAFEHGRRFILCNDGGTLVGPKMEAPMSIDDFARSTIGYLEGTQINTFYWQLGTDPYLSTPTHRYSDIYSHETKVAPIWGDETETFETSGAWRIYENARHMREMGTDPAAVVIEKGHEAGVEVFLSMRVNDIHDGLFSTDDPDLLSPTKKAHPEWLLGAVKSPAGGGRFRRFSRFAYDFEIDDVRSYKLAIATEAIENYDLDGLDWDFCRFPRYFREGRARQNAGLITEMLRMLRAKLDAKSKEAGRKLQLSVRVPPTFEIAMEFGLDVRSWIDEGLIDILIAGVVHGSLHRVPVEDYVEATRGKDIEAIAQNLGLFWWDRPFSARVVWNEPDVFSPEMCRASAATYWQAGVDGLYLWNNHLIEFNRYAPTHRQPWREIGDPNVIDKLDKHYMVDTPPNWEDLASELGGPPVPPGQLPASLADAGDTASVKIDIADDIDSPQSQPDVVVRLLVTHLTSVDSVTWSLNGAVVDAGQIETRLLYNDCWLTIRPTAGQLKRGWNEISVSVGARNPGVAAPLSWANAEVLVSY
jgi:hypothetical protein